MKTKIATTITLAVTAILAASQSAQANDKGLNRFDFAPNNYRVEEPNAPKDLSPPAPMPNVRMGHVPMGGLLGGLDPTFLKPAPPPRPVVAPIAQKSTSFTPSFGHPVPTAAVPTSLPAFNKNFGNPLAAPAQGVLPQPKAATAPHAPATIAAKPSRPLVAMHHNSNVHGVLSKPRLPQGQSAQPAILSYGNQGYSSGAYTPVTGASGGSSSTALRGTILPRHK